MPVSYTHLDVYKRQDLNWDGDYDEEDDKIAGAQALRGYHTLEYLIFKDALFATCYPGVTVKAIGIQTGHYHGPVSYTHLDVYKRQA